MERQGLHRSVRVSALGGEKEQMWNLNHRLETYLNRVKLLDEENTALAKEIQALRSSHHRDLPRRKGLEEELQHARQKVDMIWKERVYAEVEVGRLTEALQTLDLQLQRESQARMEAKTKVDQSRRELEEERRAQMWLREKVDQLEHEMKSLIQTHQEDVAHLEATLMQSRATAHTVRPARQAPNVLELGQEYSQRANQAWQEATEAYQGQLARLEESVKEAWKRLTQVNHEKNESLLKLQSLDKEMTGLQEVRVHLEKTVDQQRESHCQDMQQLQEHMEALERERQELAQHIDQLLLENRGLVQMKMSLNLEVATYRALLDSDGLRGDISLEKQPRNIHVKDSVFSPWGVKENYQTQLPPSPKTTSLSSFRSEPGKSKLGATTATPILYRKPTPVKERLDISTEKVQIQSETKSNPYPKILKDGAVENFRPQEVNEKVTFAEPLFPPNEDEVLETKLEKDEEFLKDSVDQPSEEQPFVKSDHTYQVESSLNNEISYEAHPQLVQPFNAGLIGELCSFTEKSMSLEMPFEKEEMKKLQPPVDAWIEKKDIDNTKAMDEQQESSDSETEAVLEPNFETRSRSPASECEPAECDPANQLVDIIKDDVSHEDAAVTSDDTSPSLQSETKDKLYPDGEEMDTWDSVIERNPGMKTDDMAQTEEAKTQHAEPEEDISARETQQSKQVMTQDVDPEVNMTFSTAEPQIDDNEQNASMNKELSDKDPDDEQEDSQNISMSWRTELECDSYAQDNTLADTSPLIRYKSDETDANTQASRDVEDIDSSDSEQDKKVEEMESGMWSEDKTRRFGTMEDLCEDAEGEVLDEEYDLGYIQSERKEDGRELAMTENDWPGNDKTKYHEVTEELNRNIVENRDEELDTDKLVEQELENLSTDCYSTHLAQQQVNAKDTVPQQRLSVQQMVWAIEKTEDTPLYPETLDEENLPVSESQADSKKHFSDFTFEGPQMDIDAEQQEDEELSDDAEKVEDKHDVSMGMHCDLTEDFTEIKKELAGSSPSQDFVSLSMDNLSSKHKEQENSELEENQSTVQDWLFKHDSHSTGDYSDNEVNQSSNEYKEQGNSEQFEENHSVQDGNCSNDDVNQSDKLTSRVLEESLPDNSYRVELRDPVTEKIFLPEEVVAESPEVPVTAEWELLENPEENVGNDARFDSELEQKCLLSDDRVEHGATEEPRNMSPEIIHDDSDIFIVKDSTELLKNNGKANLNDLFTIGANNEFRVSPLETGATYQPDDVDTKDAEWNLGFGDVVRRESDDPMVVHEKSGMPFGSEEQEVTQILTRSSVKGEIVHSEESEDDSDALSSGEE